MIANPMKTGLTVGALISVWHVVWSLLVLIGWAQPFLNFVFWAHMIQPIYLVQSFKPAAAATLVGITFAIGFLFGSIGALIWNALHQPR